MKKSTVTHQKNPDIDCLCYLEIAEKPGVCHAPIGRCTHCQYHPEYKGSK